MDITNFTWINIFDPNKTATSPNNIKMTTQNKIIIVLVSLFGVLIILICGFFTYIWIKKRKRGQKNVVLSFLGTVTAVIMTFLVYGLLNFTNIFIYLKISL